VSFGRLTLAANEYRLGLLFCILVLASKGHGQVSQPLSTSVRIADASCAKCHTEIFKRYLGTPMANASGVASERPHSSSTVRSGAGITYTYLNDAKTARATLQSKNGAAESRYQPLQYFLGSGHLGTTYTYEIDGFYFESPIAWYAASDKFDMKPGLDELRTSAPALPLQSGCIRCHMSDVQPSDRGTINRYSNSAFLHTGITCEACHGDAARHIAKGDRTQIINPAKLSALKRDSICINCHLEGDVQIARAGRSALNFKPGDSITDLVAYYVYGGKGATVRAVSEVEQFAQSGCKRASGEKMSCLSCHDPHYTPGPTERIAFYRGKCLACHSEVQFAESHHPENKDCASCHMKATGAENIPHVAWTDHRILRVSESQKLVGHVTEEKLVAIFPNSESKRDLAMAYYKAMLAGEQKLEPTAWAQLNGLRSELTNDPEALDALGVMTAKRGDEKSAVELFKTVLAIDQNDLTALSNLGTLMARAGKLQEARQLLESAFAKNQDLSGLALNVAQVNCMAGEKDAAKKALQVALIYNPDVERLQSLNSQITNCPMTTLK
jgi:tetratricopeptide (TPR) repeat protein